MVQTNLIYINVILPVPIAGPFTYTASSEFDLVSGMRVIVPFGPGKKLMGIIDEVNVTPNEGFNIKEISQVIDQTPLIGSNTLRFWKWIADYYCCHLGEVLKLAIPQGVSYKNETKIRLSEIPESAKLNGRELKVIDALKEKALSVQKLKKETGIKGINPVLKRLFEAQYIVYENILKKGSSPKQEQLISLAMPVTQKTILLALVGRSKLQIELLQWIFDHQSLFNTQGEISKTQLLELSNANRTALSGLIAKGVLTEKTVDAEMRRDVEKRIFTPKDTISNSESQFPEILANYATVFVHRANTIAYQQFLDAIIEENIAQGKSVLWLFPEITEIDACDLDITHKYGDYVLDYHAAQTPGEHAEVWNIVAKTNQPVIVRGTRNAVFLPFVALGLIIVEEEHHPSYKPFDQNVSFHCRDSAVMLAHLYGAKTLVISQTPSAETIFNFSSNKYGLISFQNSQAAQKRGVLIVDMYANYKMGKRNFHFSYELMDAIEQALEQKEKVFIYHNRRGFSPMIECSNCGFIPQCMKCNVNLTLYKSSMQLGCNRCHTRYPVEPCCPVCQGAWEDKGLGTEKIMEEAQLLFPNANVALFDSSNIKTKSDRKRIETQLSEGKIEILIGTQMAIPFVRNNAFGVIAILNADSMLSFPDIRAHERFMQLVFGFGQTDGKMVIQTFRLDNRALQAIESGNYFSIMHQEMEERQIFNLPPYCRLIKITLKYPDYTQLDSATSQLAKLLKLSFGNDKVAIDKPINDRIDRLYFRHILIKSDKSQKFSCTKSTILIALSQARKADSFKGMMVGIEVDAQ